MRLLPVAVLLFMRVCAEEATLGPYTLPKGAALTLSPMVTHRDPGLFPNPMRFDPARWASLDPSPYAYLPFGAGARMCIGAYFAKLRERRAAAAAAREPERRVDAVTEERVDALLDKIARDGLGTLTDEERKFLKRASTRYRQ